MEQVSSPGVAAEGELCASVCAILDHAHPSLVLADVEGTCHGANEASDVLEVLPANTPGAIHQEHQVCDGTDRTLWREK